MMRWPLLLAAAAFTACASGGPPEITRSPAMPRATKAWREIATPEDRDPSMEANKRLDEIERALKFDPHPDYRRQLVREYLALTEPKKDVAA